MHSLLSLPTRGDFKDQEGERLNKLQQLFSATRYIIIDEMSMVGRKTLGQVDRRLRQAFPHHAQEVFGGCSCLLFRDFGQLPPVMDPPLYTINSRTEQADLGRTAYQTFQQAVVLDQVMRQAGQDPQQVQFRDILLWVSDAKVTVADGNCLMTRTPTRVQDLAPFATALHLIPTVEAVVEYNIAQLHASGQSPQSRLSTLDPMQQKHQLMMQKDWKQSFAWPSQLVSCSPAPPGSILVSSVVQWEPYKCRTIRVSCRIYFWHLTGYTTLLLSPCCLSSNCAITTLLYNNHTVVIMWVVVIVIVNLLELSHTTI